MSAKNYTPIDSLIRKWKQYSVGLPKEIEPILKPVEQKEMQEAVEHEPESAVKEFVQPKQETIKLPSDLTMLGLQPATSAQFSSYKNIKLPITDEKVVSGLKEPITSSRRWLSEFALYILSQAHLTLRTIGGKVVRIIRR